MAIARPSTLDPFAPAEVALATDIARLAARVLDEYGSSSAARVHAEMLADFFAMLSRELRDSMTALLTGLFVSEHGSAADHGAQIAAASAVVERMRTTLQRLDRAMPPPPSEHDESVDLAVLMREILRDLAEQVAPGARVFEQLSSVPLVRGDHHRLREALRGVAEHVLATASADTLVCVRVEELTDQVVVAISRTGSGYDAQEARHMFDAIWEGRHAERALTVARAVFAAHGGRAWVETAETAGVAFCFSIGVEAITTVA